VLELAVELEKLARRLLLGSMSKNSDAQMLLKADRIVQLRNIRSLAMQEEDRVDDDQDDSRANADGQTHACQEQEKHEENDRDSPGRKEGKEKSKRRPKINAMMKKYYEEEAELMPYPSDMSEQEALELVARYREAFAGLLVAGSKLLRLKDKEEYMFERRYWKKDQDA